MLLKLEINSQNPAVYKTEMLEFYAGSGDGSHLVIGESSVSKKHLRVLFQTGQWFVIDQDSTNGTFLNGQKLVPWVKAEFNYFDTLSLGAHVTLVFMKDSEDYDVLEVPTIPQGANNPEHEKTKVISIEEFKSSQLKAEQKRQKEQQLKRARIAREKKLEYDRISTTIIICLVILLLGFVSNKIYQARKTKIRKETIIKRLKNKNEADLEIELEILGYRIYRAGLLKRNFLISLYPLKKCNQAQTIPYCKKNPTIKGVIAHEKSLIFFLDEEEWVQKSMTLVENKKFDKKILHRLAILLVLARNFKNFEDLEDKNIYLSFFSVDEQGYSRLGFVGALKGENLEYILPEFKESVVYGEKSIKKSVLEMEPYFTTY